MALKQRFHFVEKYPDTCGYLDDMKQFKGITMIQYNIDSSKPLFLHRNLVKWNDSIDGICLWQKIKRLIDVENLEIFIGYSDLAKHNYVDFVKGYECLDFTHLFGGIEVELLDYLKELRSRTFYKDFLISNS
jgi:alpha 1,2-mannosyltransferase